MKLTLAPGWDGPVANAVLKDARVPVIASPIAASKISPAIVRASDADSRRRLVEQLNSTRISAIALEIVTAQNAIIDEDTWRDIRAVKPVCVALAAWVDGKATMRVRLDLVAPDAIQALGEIVRLRTTFVFHNIKPALFSLWALELAPELPAIFDTQLAAASLHLGKHRKRVAARTAESEAARIDAKTEAAAEHARLLSLDGQCRQYDIAYLPNGTAFSAPADPALAAVEKASAVLDLYRAQQPDLLVAGLHAHLHTIEFPFAIANARIEWHGVHVDSVRRNTVRQAAENAAAHYADILEKAGVIPPASRDAFLRVMASAGLAARFQCIDDGALERAEALHPLIRPFRLHRKYSRLARESWVSGGMIGADGRVHPRHAQLGAATGRNSCSMPNIAGIGRVLRPVVTAPPGRALIELDYSQIDVAVAAAEHGDPMLIEAYNSGDVYTAMAQRFYAAHLSDEERVATPSELKRTRPELRERMKTFVLAVIYNIQPQGIADRFRISLAHAQRERERFLGLFPTLHRGLDESDAFAVARGYASILSGLRREIDRSCVDNWTHNVLRNTPIQGSAAVVFKRAVIDMDRAFRGTSTNVVLPLHDAVLIECDLSDVDRVADRAAQIMCDALRSFYPVLIPKVEVNKSQPDCWNKDGHADSVDRFLDDPEFRLDANSKTRRECTTIRGSLTFDPDALDAVVLDSRAPEFDDAIWQEMFEERAAIMEFDGDLERDEAERRAHLEVAKRLGGIP